MFRVLLNDNIVDEPLGLAELEEKVYYNSALSMFLNKIDGDVIFIGSGYTTLRDLFNSDTCNLSEIVIENLDDGITYSGVIFLNDIEWNLSKMQAGCSIVSDKFIQSIDNNKGIKIQLGIGLTKNLENRNTVVQSDITLFNPQGNQDISDYFNPANGGDAAYSVIMTGSELREGNQETTPLLSFNNFFDDINKLHNLAGVIEGNTLRIEPKAYFRELEDSVTIENINELTQECNLEEFYASIKMGSVKVADNYNYLIKLSYNGFQKEQFFLEGQCNINNELNLELQTLITDTNIIQDIQPIGNGGTDNDDFDDDIIIIHCKSNNYAYPTPSPLTSNYYYNQFFTNGAASQRWAETYPFSIFQLLDSLNPLVRATLGNDQTDTTSPTGAYFSPDIDSVPPNFDTGNDWQIGNILVNPNFTTNVGYFEAPTDMVVTVRCDFHVTGYYANSRIWHVNDIGETQNVFLLDTNPLAGFNQTYVYINYHNVVGGTTFYMPSGTRLYVSVGVNTIHAGGIIEITQTGAYGGVYEVINSNNAYISKTTFDYPIDAQTWQTIRNNQFKRIRGTFVGGAFSGFASDLSRNMLTGQTSVELYQRKNDIIDG